MRICNGVLYFFRTNHWHSSPWHFIVDGKDNIVKETATDAPINADKKFTNTEFIPLEPFPKSMAYTWSVTKGADLLWVPMPFRESMHIAYSRTFYGTGYYIYHLFANQEKLSQPLKSWNTSQQVDQDVSHFIGSAGTDIAPLNIKKVTGAVKLNNKSVLLANINANPSVLRALKLKLPLDKAIDLERIKLKVTWDNAKYPSIDAPIALFFGAGTFFNREKKEFLVKGLPINIHFNYPDKKLELACYYPMPFFKSAKIELTGIEPGGDVISYELRYEPLKQSAQTSSYFHATYKDIPEPELGQDMTWLDTKGIEGHTAGLEALQGHLLSSRIMPICILWKATHVFSLMTVRPRKHKVLARKNGPAVGIIGVART